MKSLRELLWAKHSKSGTLAVLITMLCIASCKQNWYCYGIQYNITAIRGADTIYNQVNTVDGSIYTYNTAYADSVMNYYKSNGYNVFFDTSESEIQTVGNNKSEIKAMEEDGLTCVQTY